LEEQGIEVLERVPHEIPANSVNRRYLGTKALRMGHILELLEPDEQAEPAS